MEPSGSEPALETVRNGRIRLSNARGMKAVNAPLPPGSPTRTALLLTLRRGPGVTPVIQWEGAGLGRDDAARDVGFNALFDSFLANDAACRNER